MVACCCLCREVGYGSLLIVYAWKRVKVACCCLCMEVGYGSLLLFMHGSGLW